MKTKLFLLFSVIILFLAAVPRSIETVNGNFLFGFDQGLFWGAAKTIVVDHKFTLIGDEVGGKGGFFQGAGWRYVVSIAYLVTNGNPYGSILLMFILGMGTIALVLVLFQRKIGLLATLLIAFFIAISPAIIAQSRFMWPPFVIPLLTVLYLYLWYRYIEKKKFGLFFLFLLIGIMSHFEVATCIPLAAVTVLICLPIVIKRRNIFSSCTKIIGGFFIPFIPLFLFDLRHGFLNVKGILRLITGGNADQIMSWSVYKEIITNHIAVFSANLFGTFEPMGTRIVWISIVAGVLLWMLFDKKILKEKKIFVIVLFLLPILRFIVLLGYRTHMWEWWLLDLPVVYCFLVGIALSYLFSKTILFKAFVIFVLIFQVNAYWHSTSYFLKSDLYDYGGTQKIKGRTEAVETIFEDADGQPFNVLVFTPPVYTYPYDFLFWYIGTKKYGFMPGFEKKDPLYLLMEPDPSKPDSYNGWIETVVKPGKLIDRKELPSGFIIEKRMAQ